MFTRRLSELNTLMDYLPLTLVIIHRSTHEQNILPAMASTIKQSSTVVTSKCCAPAMTMITFLTSAHFTSPTPVHIQKTDTIQFKIVAPPKKVYRVNKIMTQACDRPSEVTVPDQPLRRYFSPIRVWVYAN